MGTSTTYALTRAIALTVDGASGVVTWRELEETEHSVNGGIAVIDGDVLVLTNAGSHRHTYGDEDSAEDDADFGRMAALEPWTRARFWRWHDDVYGEEPVTRFAGSGDPVDA